MDASSQGCHCGNHTERDRYHFGNWLDVVRRIPMVLSGGRDYKVLTYHTVILSVTGSYGHVFPR